MQLDGDGRDLKGWRGRGGSDREWAGGGVTNWFYEKWDWIRDTIRVFTVNNQNQVFPRAEF